MKKRILIIDDDALVLKSLSSLLVRSDYEVESAKSGEEAQLKLSTANFDLIISDIRMPRQDGITVMRNLEELCLRRYNKKIPFIFITGYASEEAPIDAIKLGAKDYILKPFDMDELLNSVKQYIQ